MSSALEAGRAHLEQTRRLFLVAHKARNDSDPERRAWRNAHRIRLRRETEWQELLERVSDGLLERLSLDEAITYARAHWQTPVTRSRWRWVQRAAPRLPEGVSPEWVSTKLQQYDDARREVDRARYEAAIELATQLTVDEARAAMRALQVAGHESYVPPTRASVAEALAAGLSAESLVQGAVISYLGMALTTSQDAGQFALDRLGLDRTFAWANPRSMARDLFAVRGSKVIQNLYGAHVNELSKLIIDATDPRKPQTLAEVRAAIKERWPELRAYQVARIARTETAAVWTATAVNAYRANGIALGESIIAHGPSIDQGTVAGACPICIEAAAAGPYNLGGNELPPWHPNCRCEVVPILEDSEGNPWLPPDEPWTGGTIEDFVGENLELSRRLRKVREELAL